MVQVVLRKSGLSFGAQSMIILLFVLLSFVHGVVSSKPQTRITLTQVLVQACFWRAMSSFQEGGETWLRTDPLFSEWAEGEIPLGVEYHQSLMFSLKAVLGSGILGGFESSNDTERSFCTIIAVVAAVVSGVCFGTLVGYVSQGVNCSLCHEPHFERPLPHSTGRQPGRCRIPRYV